LISIAIPSISKVVKYGKDKSYDLLVMTIEDSAKLHVSQDRRAVQDVIKDIGVHEITLAELIEAGKLKEGIIDPRTNEEISTTKKVLVMYKEDMSLLYCYEDNNCPEPYIPNFIAPVITLLGDNPVTIYQGETYVDAGATALDDIDGDITDSIIVNSNIDIHTPGEYTVTYNVNDAVGNEATELIRTVVILQRYLGEFDLLKKVNKPKLAQGMIPIKWDETSLIETIENDPDWYEYGDTPATRKWANAVSKDTSGNITAYWVWIPRYAYQIASGYNLFIAGTINIKFLKNNTDETNDDNTVDTIPTYSGSSQTNFIRHPAFTFDNTELTGIWVAKFEISGSTEALKILPGVVALHDVQIGNMFIASRNMEKSNLYGWDLVDGTLQSNGIFSIDNNNVDTHMMKNIEWGAVAYLSQSIYGKNAEIWNNSNTSYLTGCAGSGVDAKIETICYEFNTPEGTNASTTGTVYGIYDISGGSNELVAAYYGSGNSNGTSILNAHNKYKNVYTDYNNNIKGDAVFETSTTFTETWSWYGDYSWLPISTAPWFNRGGAQNAGSTAGAFNFNRHNGIASNDDGWRVVLLVGV
ncbi:MAG: DUF5011 domain-containing protein, partial [Bacilli bacterium]|nr:DUF5011 domain-containing protein [Bacilli bacterium]